MYSSPDPTSPLGSRLAGIRDAAPSRRSVVRAAAWAAPAVSLAAAAPAFAASTGTLASVAWSDSSTSLLQLRVLDSASLITAGVLVTVPTEITITNSGTAPITGAQVTIAVARPAGINIPVGRARSFGVAAFNSLDTAPASRSVTYQSAAVIGEYGFPTTSWTGTAPTIPAGGSAVVPVELGLAGVSTGVSISALSAFPATVTVTDGAATVTASAFVSVPVGAGIL